MGQALEILLVEDNAGDVEMTKRALRTASTPCRVEVASNGSQALDCLHKAGRYEGAVTPQLILLDINMPMMDGKAFLDRIKVSEDFKTIPVVMFTSSESPRDVQDCYERHANGYVVKPFDGQAYAAAVRGVIDFWGSLSTLPQ